MLTAGTAILAGCIIACFSATPVDALWCSFLPLVVFLGWRDSPRRLLWLVWAAFLWASLHIHLQLRQQLPTDLHNKEVIVQGEVIDLPIKSSHSLRFLLRVDLQNSTPGLPSKLRLSWRDLEVDLNPGQIWQLKTVLKPAHGYQNPGGFDFERWLFAQGIAATGYVRNAADNRLIETRYWSLDRWRDEINLWIESQCQSCTQKGLIKALATGYRGDLSLATRDILQRTGSAHLIAVSGLHIGIVAGFGMLLTRLLWRLLLHRWIRDVGDLTIAGGVLAGASYALLAGFALPAQRALIMLCIVAVLRWTRCPFNLLSAILLSLCVVLLLDPLSVLSTSFWLTFCALTVIALGAFLVTASMSWVQRLFLFQLLFALLFVPLTMVIFNQVHSASLLSNLVAVPLVSLLIVPLNFALLGLFWLPEPWLVTAYQLLDGLLEGLMFYLDAVQAVGFRAIDMPRSSPWLILVLLLWMLYLLLPRGVAMPRFLLWVLPLIGIAHAWQRDAEALTLTVLDVGMGTSVVVQTRHHVLIYDFGPGKRDGYSLGKWVVEPFLQYAAIHEIDHLVISHADQDHMGGLYALAARFRNSRVSSGTPLQLKIRVPELKHVRSCHDQKPWHWDGVSFEFLSVPASFRGSKNNRSCVLSIRLAQQHVLLAGDIEARQERLLIARYRDQLRADILLSPHHGSLSSSSTAFVRATRPTTVIHTAGFLNRWRFPRPEVVKRYAAVGAGQYQTGRDGAIQVVCDFSDCAVSSYRQQNRAIWY